MSLTSLISDALQPTRAPEADMSTVYDVLANERRREVIRIVRAEGCTDLRELADQLAAIEADGQPDANERKAAYVTLYQHHLDSLAEAGIVAWDKREGSVRWRRTPTSQAAWRLLDVSDDLRGGCA